MADLTGTLCRNTDASQPDTWLIGVRGGEHKPLAGQSIHIQDRTGRHITLTIRESWSGGTPQPDGTILKVNEDGAKGWSCIVYAREGYGGGQQVGSYTDKAGNLVTGPGYHQSCGPNDGFPVLFVEADRS